MDNRWNTLTCDLYTLYTTASAIKILTVYPRIKIKKSGRMTATLRRVHDPTLHLTVISSPTAHLLHGESMSIRQGIVAIIFAHVKCNAQSLHCIADGGMGLERPIQLQLATERRLLPSWGTPRDAFSPTSVVSQCIRWSAAKDQKWRSTSGSRTTSFHLFINKNVDDENMTTHNTLTSSTPAVPNAAV